MLRSIAGHVDYQALVASEDLYLDLGVGTEIFDVNNNQEENVGIEGR